MNNTQIFAHEPSPAMIGELASAATTDYLDFGLAGKRFAVYERADDEHSPGIVVGQIRLQSPDMVVPEMWNDIQAAGVEPSILGMRVQFWLDRLNMTDPIMPARVARLAIGIAQEYNDGRPWALLSHCPDDPASELAQAGMHQQGNFQSGWRSVAKSNAKYALYVACCGVVRVRRNGKGGAFSLSQLVK